MVSMTAAPLAPAMMPNAPTRVAAVAYTSVVSKTSPKFASTVWGVSLRSRTGSSCCSERPASGDVRFVRVVDVRAAADGNSEEVISFGSTFGVNGNGAAGAAAGNNGGNGATLVAERERPFTGGATDFRRATAPLTPRPMANAKTVVLVRHGLSSWNAEGRVQGSSDKSILSEIGRAQAVQVREALSLLKFDKCFASPITRAKTSAELIWEGREDPIMYLDTLREANLLFLEGMLNSEAKEKYPELFRSWREDPLNFHVDGVYPVVELWAKAKLAWEEILSTPGERLVVVTHKSILRAMLCTALGLGPDRFRGVDVHNAGISTFTVNKRGEPMLSSLNRTAHLHVDGVHYLD